MIGAIIGDVIGSTYEFNNDIDNYDFDLFPEATTFTDDTVCTVAVADAILHGRTFESSLWDWCHRYPGRGYGGRFQQWLSSKHHKPYNSYGNGSAMRVSPVGWAYDDLSCTLSQAQMSAIPTHNHPEGIKGAQVVAQAIYMLRQGDWDKIGILLKKEYGENYEERLPAVGEFDETCQGCVPLALRIFLQSSSFEDAIRSAIHYGGDSDTLAAIVGSMAEAYYDIPEELLETTMGYLPDDIREVYEAFRAKYVAPKRQDLSSPAPVPEAR